MPDHIPSLHVPTYMHVLRDPIKNLLNYMDKLHMITPLCGVHGDEKLMKLAEKVTTIIHDIYITDSERLGYQVDQDSFSLRGQHTLGTKRASTALKQKFKNLIRRHGRILHNEHKLFDDIIREVVQPKFSAFWFETSERLFENGPLVIQMPTVIIGHAMGNRVLELEPEHEQQFQLEIDDAVLEPIITEPVIN